MNQRTTPSPEKQRGWAVFLLKVFLPDHFPASKIQTMQVTTDTHYEYEITIDYRTGPRCILYSETRSQPDRIIEFPVPLPRLGMEALNHFPSIQGMKHHQTRSC